MFLTETLTISFTRTFGFQEQKLLARIHSSCCTTEGFFIITAAFSFKSERIPAVTMAFIIKDKVSSRLLQNIRNRKTNIFLKETQTRNEMDPSLKLRKTQEDWEEEKKLAGVRENNAEVGKRPKELIHSAERKKERSKTRHRNGWEKLSVCLEIMTVVVTLF